MSWLSGWNYRKSITLSRASGAVSNYQMKLLVGESAGATGEDVDCNSHVLPNFNDLRFTKADGQTLLDYWIESITGLTPDGLATVWIEFDSIGTGATTFYMYYGKADAPAVSNGANTFIVFDDFERGNDGDDVGGAWTIAEGSAKISTAQKYGGTRSLKMFGGAANGAIVTIPVAASDNIAIRYRAYKSADARIGFQHGESVSGWTTSLRYDPDEDIEYYDGSTYIDTGVNIAVSTWELGEVRDFIWANGTVDIWHNNSKITDDADVSYASSEYANKVSFSGYLNTTNKDYWIDDFIVRNFRTVEPAWGSWGSEEEEGPPTGTRFVSWIY